MRVKGVASSLAWEFVQKASNLGILYSNYAETEKRGKEQAQEITRTILALMHSHPQYPGNTLRLTQEELGRAAFTFLFEPLDFVHTQVLGYPVLQHHPMLRTCQALKRAVLEITLSDMGGKYGRFPKSGLVSRIDRFYDSLRDILTPTKETRGRAQFLGVSARRF